MTEAHWVPSTQPGFENLVVGHNRGLNLPVYGGWRRLRDNHETVLVAGPDGKPEWVTRVKTTGTKENG